MVGGWWVGGLHLQNKATAWPNLHVRTCKIQAKLDSKLGPSVAIISFVKNLYPLLYAISRRKKIRFAGDIGLTYVTIYRDAFAAKVE